MSDFLIITPSDWQELPNSTWFIDNFTGEDGMAQIISMGNFGVLDALLETAGYVGLVSDTVGVNDARTVTTNDAQERIRLWLKMGPPL